MVAAVFEALLNRETKIANASSMPVKFERNGNYVTAKTTTETTLLPPLSVIPTRLF